MPKFKCIVCGESFQVPESALEKYPNWEPRYCREHSPVRKKEQHQSGVQQNKQKKKNKVRTGGSQELDYTLEQVRETFSAGPDTGVFTDGSARPNPGPGGWGVVMVQQGVVVTQKHGHESHTTNNRMELVALIEAFTLIPEDMRITVHTDSELCLNIITKWAAGWEARGWKRKGGPIKNLDLVQKLYALAKARPQVTLQWIEAHNGWLWNEYADSLATAWARDTL